MLAAGRLEKCAFLTEPEGQPLLWGDTAGVAYIENQCSPGAVSSELWTVFSRSSAPFLVGNWKLVRALAPVLGGKDPGPGGAIL